MLRFAVIENNLVKNIVLFEKTTDCPFTNNYIQITDSTHDAGIGFSYDSANNVFIPQKPQVYPSWIFNYNTFEWESPIAKPSDYLQNPYAWDEANTKWTLLTQEPYKDTFKTTVKKF